LDSRRLGDWRRGAKAEFAVADFAAGPGNGDAGRQAGGSEE
jgi:hypothetical protein